MHTFVGDVWEWPNFSELMVVIGVEGDVVTVLTLCSSSEQHVGKTSEIRGWAMWVYLRRIK